MRQIHKRAKRSIIWKIPIEEFQNHVQSSTSLSELLNKCGLENKGGNTNTLKRRLIEEKIDYSHIPLGIDSNKGRKFYNLGKMTIEEVNLNLLIKDSKFSRDTVKRYLKHYNLLPYICNECKIHPVWNNKPLSLQLDHKNGISNDNNINNLQWICPNCHSQTDTYAGKKHKKIFLCPCGNERCKTSILCNTCYQKSENRTTQYNSTSREFTRKVIRPSKETLEKEILEVPMTHLGKKYGVSDNAVRKWCKSYGINVSNGRGYWSKSNL